MKYDNLKRVLSDLKKIREDSDRKRKEALKEIFAGGHLFIIFKALFVLLSVLIIIWVSCLLVPFNYIFWSISNRKTINFWLLVLFNLMILILIFQLYKLFQFLPTTLLLPVVIFSCINAGFGFMVFIVARYTLFTLGTEKISRITMNSAVGLYLFLQSLNMSIWVMIFMIIYSLYHANNYTAVFLSGVIGLLWVTMIGFFFIKYPEDTIISKLKQYELQLWNWIKVDSGKDK